MRADEIEDIAIEGGKLPDYLDSVDTLLFLMFRNLYDFARRSEMDMEQGRREKQQILRTYRLYKADQEYALNFGRLMCDCDIAKCNFRKAETVGQALDAADRIIEALDRIPVHHRFELSDEDRQISKRLAK